MAALLTAGVAASGQPTGLAGLPERAQSEKSQGVPGTESPDSSNNTLKKTENFVSVFLGELQFRKLDLSHQPRLDPMATFHYHRGESKSPGEQPPGGFMFY